MTGSTPAAKTWRPLVPAYYWAGNGSAIVHRLKGFDRPIDADAYGRAYDRSRLAWLRDAFGVDTVFLSYNWGLPPEVERADWDVFEQAAGDCRALGMRAVAYVQPSNAVYLGSYIEQDWYATTPRGKKIPYYNGRFFTCLSHPAWRATVIERAVDAARRGADGVFLDNCAFGGMPIPLTRDYTAFAGCYCARCQESFKGWQRARGQRPTGVPRLFQPGRNPVAREFAHWRAWTLTGFLREIRSALREAAPDAKLLTNTVGAVNVNTYNVFGVDLPELAGIVDWLFVENLQSPRATADRLVQNAGTFKLLQALKPGAPTLSICYERGIGVDGVPPPAVFGRIMAEGYAAGGSPVVRASEYIESRTWTLLQPGRHAAHARATRQVTAFVEAHPELYRGRRPAATVGVYVPPGLGWRGDVFPDAGADYLGVIQALVGAAIPFRVVANLGDLDGLRALLVPAGAREPDRFDGIVLPFADLGIEKRRRSLFDWFALPLEPLLSRAGPWVVDGYYSRVHVRRFIDRLDLLYRLVFHDQFAPLGMHRAVERTLRSLQAVHVRASGPVYADLWESDAGLQLHLVNYGEAPVTVELTLGAGGRAARIFGPDRDPDGEACGRELRLENYAVVCLAPAPAATAVLARTGP
jgi:hypothetical protein